MKKIITIFHKMDTLSNSKFRKYISGITLCELVAEIDIIQFIRDSFPKRRKRILFLIKRFGRPNISHYIVDTKNIEIVKYANISKHLFFTWYFRKFPKDYILELYELCCDKGYKHYFSDMFIENGGDWYEKWVSLYPIPPRRDEIRLNQQKTSISKILAQLQMYDVGKFTSSPEHAYIHECFPELLKDGMEIFKLWILLPSTNLEQVKYNVRNFRNLRNALDEYMKSLPSLDFETRNLHRIKKLFLVPEYNKLANVNNEFLDENFYREALEICFSQMELDLIQN